MPLIWYVGIRSTVELECVISSLWNTKGKLCVMDDRNGDRVSGDKTPQTDEKILVCWDKKHML